MNIFKNIKTHYDTNYNLGTTPTLYLKEGPDIAEKPFVVMDLVSNIPTETFDNTNEIFNMQFNIFENSNSVAAIELIKDELQRIFDNTLITMDSGTNYFTKRTATRLEYFDKIWQYNIEYIFEVQA